MRNVVHWLLASSCIAGIGASPAFAQEIAENPQSSPATPASDADTGGGAIVVTGSRISRPNVAAAAPITSVTSESIRAQAAVNIEEVMNRVPQVAPDSQQNYQDSDGRQRLKLRNLGFERTLILVDGKRMGTMNGVDINMIPTSLIQRVDVLTGGASAVYGSDAIAGVVNFIMNDNFEGIQVNANYNFYAHDNKPGLVSEVAAPYAFAQPRTGNAFDGGRTDLSLTVGKKLFDDRFHISAYVNYRQADYVPYSARETSGCRLTETVIDGPLTCFTDPGSRLGYVGAGGAEYANNPDGSRSFVPYNNLLGTNPNDLTAFQRSNERWNAGGFTSFEISNAAELYGSVMWFRDTSANPYAARVLNPATYGTDANGDPLQYQVNCDNPLMSPSQAQAICGAAAGTSATAPINAQYRFLSPAAIYDSYVNEGFRATAGIRGEFAEGWRYDLGGVYARNRMDMTWGRPDYGRVNNALNVRNVGGTLTCASGAADGCVPFDAFSANSSLNDAALFQYLTEGNYGTNTTVNTLYNVIGTVQGDLGTYGITSPWAEQGVAIAIGGEYREDQLDGYADAVWRQNYGGTDQRLAQNAWEGNVELQVPIAENKPFADLLQFNGAYRLSKYSSNPDTFSTWKAEAIWSPISDITFRGSINRAQRAPTVVEAFQGSNVSYGFVDPSFNDICAPSVTFTTDPATGQQVPVYGSPVASLEACRATGLADNLYGSATLLCPTGVGCTARGGGFTVDPETAYTKTFGVVLKPSFLPGLIVSVDRYLIDLDDSIGYNDVDYFSNGCAATGSEFFCRMFVRNADGTLFSNPNGNPETGFIRRGTTNYYQSKSHGWDFQGQYDLRLGAAGRLNFDFSGSLATLIGGQDSPALPTYNCARGYYGSPCNQLVPKWTHNFRTTYTTDDRFFTLSVNWRHLGPLTNTSNSGDPDLNYAPERERATFYRLGAQNYFDLSMAFRVNAAYTFRLAVNNILDRTPPLLPNSYNFGLSRNNTLSARYDSLGRQIAAGVTLNF